MTVVGVDTGGTFTDIVAEGKRGTIHIKVPSTPDSPEQAILTGLKELFETHQIRPTTVVHGTTVGTNALLERRGAKVLLITNAGFEDILFLRRQNRPELYALHPVLPPPLVPQTRTFGISGRIDPAGEEIEPLPHLETWIDGHRDALQKAEAIAISLLHSYANPIHERKLGIALQAIFPNIPITLSSTLVPLAREYERTQTTVANSYIAPKTAGYLQRLQATKPARELFIMGSAGGCLTPETTREAPILTALSGPAGGLIAAKAIGERAQRSQLLSFDMGGTSTDIAVIDHDLRPADDGAVGDIRLRTPLLRINTIGSGGGSIAFIDDGGVLRVGPHSAGAIPGPACYGKQDNCSIPTVTDAHVVLQRIESLLGGSLSLNVDAARKAIEPLAKELSCSIEETATAIIDIANATMARVCKQTSLDDGIDPRVLTLVAFGGAGGLHACEVADEMGCRDVLFPAESGLFSAEGMLQAPLQSHHTSTLFIKEAKWDTQIESVLDSATNSATKKVLTEFPLQDPSQFEIARYFDIKYEGQTSHITVSEAELIQANSQKGSTLSQQLRHAFEKRHKLLFDYSLDRCHSLTLVAIRIFASFQPTTTKDAPRLGSTETTANPLKGPRSLGFYGSTLWLPEGWNATKLVTGDLLCRRENNPNGRHLRSPKKQIALGLEIHRQRLAAIAEEMGAVLKRAAFSANIKERQDYSCALFSSSGDMLAHAAHIPVHLGSQPLSIAAAREALPIRPNQSILLNDPFAGGTHLPDVTVIFPVFDRIESDEPTFFVANRAHHADIGGISPGSLPAPIDRDGNPRKLSIHDEGIRLPPTFLTEKVRSEFSAASRTPKERLGDLRAQEAANSFGHRRVLDLCATIPTARLKRLNNSLLDYAETKMRAVIKNIPDGSFSFCDSIHQGPSGARIPIPVTITIAGDLATVDFTRAPKALSSPLNAVRAITVAAVFYVFQCIAKKDVPANSGMLRPITILTKPGTICDATYPSAVSAGNVETSQRLVDVLFGALAQAWPNRIPAASGGSMNNILFGGTRTDGSPFIHYETLACGAGASSEGPGADGVHTHMTNTLNTPIEQLEREFPVRILCYELRTPDKSNPSEYRGGRGIRRKYEFLSPAEVTIISERRETAPYGMNGGSEGQRGLNWLKRKNQPKEILPAKTTVVVQPKDQITVETPGGGAYKPAG